jgi:ketosteroid isomerase-like protein
LTELAMPERKVVVSGDWAFEVSSYEWTLAPKAGGQAIRDRANWVGIWRRGPESSWMETRGIWNSTLPLSGTQ